MMRLKLSDGTVFDGGYLLNVDGKLFLYIPDTDLRTVFNKLIEPAKTASISFIDGTDEHVFEGFTKLTAVNDEGNGLITAVIGKEVA